MKVKSNQSKCLLRPPPAAALLSPARLGPGCLVVITALLTTPRTALSHPDSETGREDGNMTLRHSPVYDGHDVHNPEAEPEHEVARGQEVQEDHQASRHHSVPGPDCPHPQYLRSLAPVFVSPAPAE